MTTYKEQAIVKGIFRKSRDIFGQSIDQQYIACGISHALKYPELSSADAIQLGMASIKLMMGCSLNTSIEVVK